ncbi:kinase-like domain-containing protein, partial [Dichotomopilus funicola]
ADASQQHEIDTLSRLKNGALEKAAGGEALTPIVLDRFNVQAPNGTHLCFTTTPARCSLTDTKEASFCCLFQLDVARSLAAQLVIAIAHAHERGVVHGDLHLGNILLRLPTGLDGLSTEQLYEKYRAPEPEPVVRLDGKPLPPGVPSCGVPPMWLGDQCERILLSDAKLLLADFGVAFRPSSEQRYQSHTPLELRPPEARFEPTTPLSFPSDVWSLGCTIWSLLAHRSLFDVFLATEDDVTAQQIDVLGLLPDEWWEKWEARSKYFAENGQQPAEGRSVWSWEHRFEQWIREPRRDKGMATLDGKEEEAFAVMIRWMLQFRPRDRPSAKEVLETEWMRTWALPECGRVLELTSPSLPDRAGGSCIPNEHVLKKRP